MKNELKGIIDDKKYLKSTMTFCNAIISFLEVNLVKYTKMLNDAEKELKKIEKRESNVKTNRH